MSALTEFLLARIAEDEAAARATRDESWEAHPLDGLVCVAGNASAWVARTQENGHADDRAAHIARHDPARVLAECEAKRRILARHTPYDRVYYDAPSRAHKVEGQGCDWCYPDGYVVMWPCPDVRDLAAVYADHPDYDEAWRA